MDLNKKISLKAPLRKSELINLELEK